jgi:hypothetical protein
MVDFWILAFLACFPETLLASIRLIGNLLLYDSYHDRMSAAKR